MIHVAPEHEFEAAHGLPEALPADEKILWQGAPQWQALARSAFHIRQLAVYFGVILALRMGFAIGDGNSVFAALQSTLLLAPLALIALGTLAIIAWYTAQTAVYTITSKRVVMRIGVVLNITFNIPFRVIETAGLASAADGSGDITLRLSGHDRIAYLNLWPHARPWKITRTEPMLRSIANAAEVGAILSAAIAAASGGTALGAGSVASVGSSAANLHANPGLSPAY